MDRGIDDGTVVDEAQHDQRRAVTMMPPVLILFLSPKRQIIFHIPQLLAIQGHTKANGYPTEVFPTASFAGKNTTPSAGERNVQHRPPQGREREKSPSKQRQQLPKRKNKSQPKNARETVQHLIASPNPNMLPPSMLAIHPANSMM